MASAMGDEKHAALTFAGLGTRQAPGADGRQRGQALILFLVSLLVLCIGVIMLFNTGQTVSKKVELVNAADAAAYSAAVQQARAYNLIAYMNRAEVANEVAVAQIVTLYSMTNYVLSATKNLKETARNLSYALYVLAIFTEGATLPIANAFQRVASMLGKAQTAITNARNGMQTPFAKGIQILSQGLNGAYAKATSKIELLASADASYLAKQIVDKNTDGKARIGVRGLGILVEQVREAGKYTRQYSLKKRGSNADGADRFANVVMEARDGFSRKRNGEVLFGAIKKRGGTDVVTASRSNRYYDSWVAADTLNFYFPTPWPFSNIDLPLAWGGAAATKNTRGGFSRVAMQGFNNGRGWDSPYTTENGLHIDRYGGAVDNHKAGKKVRNDPAVGGTSKAWLKNYQGLHDYDDIVADKATVPYLNGKSAAQNGVKALDVGPIFTVLVEQSLDTVRTSTHVDGIGGPPDFEVPDEGAGDSLTALSSAQVYFSRPRGFGLFDNVLDSRREMGSLFSPYWQARLVDTPCNIRQTVALSYGSVAPCMPGKG